MRVVIVDNFDSFTHNLAQAFGALGAEVVVIRNDAGVGRILEARPDRLVLSPGPGGPDRTGASSDAVAALRGRVPILGVCLGMQLLATLEGASVVRAPRPVHGESTVLSHDGGGLFGGIEQGVAAGRYHSLAVEPSTLPSSLVPTAWSDGVLMGLRDAAGEVEGIQFHPESVLTPAGPRMLANFLQARWMAPGAGGPKR